MKKNVLFIVFILLIATGFSQDIKTGLVARYSFCGNLLDISGNENHGLYMGLTTPTYTTDYFGNENQAMFFNGINDWVNVLPSETMNSPVDEATVSCWVNYQSYYFGQWVPIFAKTDGDAVVSRQYSLGNNCLTGQIYWHSTYVAQSDELELNKWFHIAVTYTPDLLKCYLNGEFIGEAEPNDLLTENEQPFQIGRDTPSSTDYFHGVLDEVNVYNRALTADDVMALTNYNGCDPSSVSEDIFIENINVFPNPMETTLNIDLSYSGKFHMRLFNSMGQILLEKDVLTKNTEIDVSYLSKGIYYLQIKKDHGGYFHSKVIKN